MDPDAGPTPHPAPPPLPAPGLPGSRAAAAPCAPASRGVSAGQLGACGPEGVSTGALPEAAPSRSGPPPALVGGDRARDGAAGRGGKAETGGSLQAPRVAPAAPGPQVCKWPDWLRETSPAVEPASPLKRVLAGRATEPELDLPNKGKADGFLGDFLSLKTNTRQRMKNSVDELSPCSSATAL